MDIEPDDASVASVPVANDPTETVAITLDDSLTGGITLSQCESMNPWDPGIVQTDRPPNEAIPYGLFSFQVNGIIPGGQIEVLLTFPDTLSPGARYFKVDGNGFYEFPFERIDHNIIKLTLVDSGDRPGGDSNGEPNDGVIIDPGGIIVALDPGDLNGVGDVDLVDAILGLQVVSGMHPNNVYSPADVNNDDKIGIEEVIYILQEEAGLR